MICLCWVSGVEPAIRIAGVQDDRHPVVGWLHDFVWIGGQDGEGLQRDGKGPLCLGIEPLSVVEGICGHQAAALLKHLPVGRLGGGFLGASVDRAVANWNQAPPSGTSCVGREFPRSSVCDF